MKDFLRTFSFVITMILLLPYMLFVVALLLTGQAGECLRAPFAKRILFPLIRWAGRNPDGTIAR